MNLSKPTQQLNQTAGKKGYMWWPNGPPIRGTITSVAHNLKRKLDFPSKSEKGKFITISLSQSDIETFVSESHPDAGPSENLQITPGDEAHTGATPGGSGDPGAPDSEDYEDDPVGLIYARVSSDGQVDRDDDDESESNEASETDKGSIEGQISQLEGIAEKKGISLPFDPIVDEAETGTNFDRDGIRRVFKLAKFKDIDYLLVEKIDRIGRNAAETLFFISKLQRDCGVKLLTPGGERDVDEIEGLMHTTLMSLMAEVQNQIRTEKATKEKIRQFLSEKNWKCVSPKVPLGYTETEDDWLKINPDEVEIVREIFRKFVDCESYSETETHIEEMFGEDVLEGHRLKTILQESAVIGRPKVPDQWIVDTQFENDLHEPDLNLLAEDYDDDRQVSEETFEKAQQIIESNRKKDDDEKNAYSVTDFIDEFGLFPVVKSSDVVRLIHHCGEPMVQAGQKDLNGNFDLTTHEYKCPVCEETEDPEDYFRKWPRQYEAELMEVMNMIRDGDLSLFGSDTEDSDADDDD